MAARRLHGRSPSTVAGPCAGASEPEFVVVPLSSGEIRLDLMTRRVIVGEVEHELTSQEFSMLDVPGHPGQVLSREQLLNGVWGFDYDPSSNVVDIMRCAICKRNSAMTPFRPCGDGLPTGLMCVPSR